MGPSIDGNPYGALFWNVFAIFSFTFVVSHVSFACLLLQNTVKISYVYSLNPRITAVEGYTKINARYWSEA